MAEEGCWTVVGEEPESNHSQFSYADALRDGVTDEGCDPAEADTHEAYTEEPTASYDDSEVENALAEAGESVQGAAAQLWALDAPNRLTHGEHYELDTQLKAYSCSDDEASQRLFSYMSDEVWSRPTYASFRRLLDNYTAETGQAERVSDEERLEERTFLDAICDTSVMRFTQRWLHTYANCPGCGSMDEFKETLNELWFTLYGRDGRNDSSGFEHAFCGEIDDGKVKGLHNFIQMFVEEERGNFNYMGYLEYGRQRGDVEDEDRLLTIRFQWFGEVKAASSMFVGVSPEFEFALYTMMWLSRNAGEVIELGAYDVCVKVYDMQGRIGAAFPELVGVDEYDGY